MVIYVDDRENEKLKHELIARLGDKAFSNKGGVMVRRLPYGDYILGEWAIEAKEINDLYRSIMGIGRNGRTINHQLAELTETSRKAFLVVYGTKLKPYFKGRVKSTRVSQEVMKMNRVIKSFKMTLYLRHPEIHFMQFATRDDFIEWLIVNHNRLLQEARIGVGDDIKKARKEESDPRIVALSAIAGVTEDIAEDLLIKFGSIPLLLRRKVKQKELMEIKGVGRITARRLKALSEKWSVDEEEV